MNNRLIFAISVSISYKNILSEIQWNLLKAVAKEGNVTEPTAGNFLQKYSLGSASSVSFTMKKLLEMDMVYEELNSFYVYDVFFSRWLEKLLD